ncbi:MAG TPA: ribbon-helix-helix protein, CopG family [Candidatus Saccharimonadales bacterium]|nr:ribbon-helix-helix protein, CopG family [Candidatus Saccharimonadales bacterium]
MATKTLNIALDEKLIKQIDKAVKKDMGSRSEYFRRLALDDLERRQRWEELFDAGNKLGREMGITSEEQVYQILDDYKREKRQKQAQSRS